MSQHLSEQEIVRRDKLTELEALGVNPYPPELFHVSHYSQAILDTFDAEQNNLPDVSLAGRIMSVRLMGKAAFAVLQDAGGRIQLYIGRDAICPGEDKTLYDEVFKRLVDIGDFVGVKGYVFKTKTGETSIHVSSLQLLAKSLKPLTGLSFQVWGPRRPPRCRVPPRRQPTAAAGRRDCRPGSFRRR